MKRFSKMGIAAAVVGIGLTIATTALASDNWVKYETPFSRPRTHSHSGVSRTIDLYTTSTGRLAGSSKPRSGSTYGRVDVECRLVDGAVFGEIDGQWRTTTASNGCNAARVWMHYGLRH